MSNLAHARRLADEPDFALGALRVSPSAGRAFVGDQEIRVEALAMAVLVTLADAQGATVTRDALIETCWQGRIVSDDAVARAIAKVRLLERATNPAPFTLETLPKIGYRLRAAGQSPQPEAPASRPRPGFAWPSPPAAVMAGLAGIGVAVVVLLAAGSPSARPEPSRRIDDSGLPLPRSTEVSDALMVLDEDRLGMFLRRGWDPDWKLDSEGNAALHQLMMVCERNPTHDREGVVRVARLLVEAGEDPTTPNKWKDTPLIIARTPRYCGPDHPVVGYLESEIRKRSGGGNPAKSEKGQ